MKYFAIFLFLVIIAGCSEDKVKPLIDKTINTEELPAQESWHSIVTFTDSGKTKAILHAGHLRVFTESKQTLLDSNIQVDFFDKEEHKTTTLTAKSGWVDDETQDLYAKDSVVVVSDSGVVISTEELKWRNEDRKIVSNKFVTIVSPKEKIQGYGFESDQQLRNYTIYNITYITRRDTL